MEGRSIDLVKRPFVLAYLYSRMVGSSPARRLVLNPYLWGLTWFHRSLDLFGFDEERIFLVVIGRSYVEHIAFLNLRTPALGRAIDRLLPIL